MDAERRVSLSTYKVGRPHSLVRHLQVIACNHDHVFFFLWLFPYDMNADFKKLPQTHPQRATEQAYSRALKEEPALHSSLFYFN